MSLLITIYRHETMNHAQYVVFRLRGMTLLGQPLKRGVVRSSVTPWRDGGKPLACLRQSKMGNPLFRQGYVKCFRCIYIDILQILADDQTSAQISEKLNISKRTVERHLSSIFGKLGVLSRTGAVAEALRLQLIK
ncbi:helix-turn-helix transcriptional regulator [Geobacillus sp. G4]|uniref:helix-turn-helix transcriptional regulator n=1 Tax=Geobacillus sp. G4 TaxID=3169691 RepID=UPI003338ADBB